MRHSRAVVPARRTAVRLPPPPRRPGVAPTLYRPAVTLTLRPRVLARAPRPPTVAVRGLLALPRFRGSPAAGAGCPAMVALAVRTDPNGERTGSGYESANNETIVYRGAAPARLQSADPADQGGETSSQSPRAVQTIRFVNPDPPLSLTAAAREMIKRALTKVGAFVAFPS